MKTIKEKIKNFLSGPILIILVFFSGLIIENVWHPFQRIFPKSNQWKLESRHFESIDNTNIIILNFTNGFKLFAYDGINEVPDGKVDKIIAPLTIHLNKEQNKYPYRDLFNLCEKELIKSQKKEEIESTKSEQKKVLSRIIFIVIIIVLFLFSSTINIIGYSIKGKQKPD